MTLAVVLTLMAVLTMPLTLARALRNTQGGCVRVPRRGAGWFALP